MKVPHGKFITILVRLAHKAKLQKSQSTNYIWTGEGLPKQATNKLFQTH